MKYRQLTIKWLKDMVYLYGADKNKKRPAPETIEKSFYEIKLLLDFLNYVEKERNK